MASFYLAVTSVSVSVLLWVVSSGGTVISDYWTCKSRSHFGHTQLDLPSLAYNIPYRHFFNSVSRKYRSSIGKMDSKFVYAPRLYVGSPLIMISNMT